MKNKYLKHLEYDKVLQQLINFAVTDIGKSIINKLKPINNKSEVTKNLQETTEAYRLIYQKGNMPIAPIADISIHIKELETHRVLSPKHLLDIAHILTVSRELKEYIKLYENEIKIDFSKCLNQYFNTLYANKEIEQTIRFSIIDENTIDDKASEELYQIRRKSKRIEQLIREKLESYLKAKFIQEPVITIRNERFVIPVKQEYKGEVKGFIHDISSSGATVFMEPMPVFDLNNELNSLKIQENQEIEKILKRLSEKCTGIKTQLQTNVEIIGKLDFIFAKARLAIEQNATEPVINNEKYVELKEARHPLIDKNTVVPINIELGKNFNTLIITGPNTGGKTVTLKTLGLLSAMAMSGLYIPTAEHSSIYVFDNIFTDIGDNQSIVESLSTFSSHITTIIEIVNMVTENSLVLLDELGGGTDPIEGAALGISILEYLNNKKALTIATTHYTQIKNYAVITEGFENASSDFDTTTLKPTYKLLIGVPGKSNAFEISKTLGLTEEILNSAKEHIETSVVTTEELLKKLYDDQLLIENEKTKILEQSKEIEELRRSLQRDNTKLEQEASLIISNAKIDARKILLEAKEEASEIIKKLEDSNSKTEAVQLKSNLNSKIKDIKFEERYIKSDLKTEDIQIGMNVYIPALQQYGIVDTLPNKNKEVQLQVGSLKITRRIEELQKGKKQNENKEKGKVTTKANLKSTNIATEINVIGCTVEEAIFLIDKYLDSCALSNLEKVRIVHGKGTGALKTGIHKYLKTNPHVKSFRIGTFGEGEMGVTIVELS